MRADRHKVTKIAQSNLRTGHIAKEGEGEEEQEEKEEEVRNVDKDEFTACELDPSPVLSQRQHVR